MILTAGQDSRKRIGTIAYMKAAREVGGRPAPTAAGTIYLGRFSVSLLLTMVVAIATPMTPPRDYAQRGSTTLLISLCFDVKGIKLRLP